MDRFYFTSVVMNLNFVRRFHCGPMGLTMSLQHWDVALIPDRASGLKDPVLPHLLCHLDLIPGLGTPYDAGWPKTKKKKKMKFVGVGVGRELDVSRGEREGKIEQLGGVDREEIRSGFIGLLQGNHKK